MKARSKTTYMVVFLEGRRLDEDLSECLTAACGQYTQLEEITGISRDRLKYIFTKKNKRSLMEDGMFIMKSGQYYKGEQSGGIRNKNIMIRGND